MDERSLTALDFYKIRAMLVERTVTPMGRERAAALVPVTDPQEVEVRQAETDEARQVLEAGADIPLDEIRDIRTPVWWAARGATLDGPALLDVARFLTAGRQIRDLLAGRFPAQAPTLAAYAGDIPDLPELEREIGRALGPEGEVTGGVSPEVDRVRAELRACAEERDAQIRALVEHPGVRPCLYEDRPVLQSGRMVLLVRKGHQAAIPGIVHGLAHGGSAVLVEPEVWVPLNNRMRELQAAEQAAAAAVRQQLSRRVADASGALWQAIEAVTRIDLAFAKARLALAMRGVRPALDPDGHLVLRGARHPLLRGRVVPVDVELGRDFDVLVITGPNTGGKTVVLKTVGLFCLMAQAGMQVPAAPGTCLPVFTKIFADIGDEQSIEQNLSTFSAHITHVVEILREADPGTLVLLDEVGAGTDPAEGAALAVAILDRLQRRGARVIATTHYAELKTIAAARPRFRNASLEFDLATLKPTYRLRIGVPGDSQALAIALRLGLDGEVVEAARQFLSQRSGGDAGRSDARPAPRGS